MLRQHFIKKSLMPLLALSLYMVIAMPIHAIQIPIAAKNIGNTTRREPLERNSAYDYLNDILKHHHGWNAGSFFLVLDAGVGIFGLVPSLIAEQTHTTFWGRELHIAIKLKALIIAASDQYVAGGDPFLFTEKSSSDRKKIYRDSENVFNDFYHQLSFAYSKDKMPSKNKVRKIIRRANKTGVLVAHSLFKKMRKFDSFDPLVWVFSSGQLLDKIEKIEQIIKVRDEKEAKIKVDLTTDERFQKTFNYQPSVLPDNVLYKELQKIIASIEDYSFEDDDTMASGYQIIN